MKNQTLEKLMYKFAPITGEMVLAIFAVAVGLYALVKYAASVV